MLKSSAHAAVVAATIAAALAAAHADAANLVTNGDFETGDFAGWTATPSQGASLFGVDGSGPHNGNDAAYFGSLIPYDTIVQTLATTAGTRYTVSFWLDSSITSPGPAGFVGTFGATTFVSLSEADPDFTFQPFSFNVTADSASTVLGFAVYNANYFYTLDDVAVNAVPVPEPSSWALMALGLVGVMAMRRRV